jgi:hypothetical protein
VIRDPESAAEPEPAHDPVMVARQDAERGVAAIEDSRDPRDPDGAGGSASHHENMVDALRVPLRARLAGNEIHARGGAGIRDMEP